MRPLPINAKQWDGDSEQRAAVRECLSEPLFLQVSDDGVWTT